MRRTPTALIEQLVAGVSDCRRANSDAVGIGVPSIVEFETGRVVSSANIPLRDVPLREVLGDRLGVPVFVDNDATVAALAEAHDSELQMVARDLVMLTIGTGVGGGLVLGGRIYRGATGGAGELGHTMVGMEMSDAHPAGGAIPPARVARGRGCGPRVRRAGGRLRQRAPGLIARTQARRRRAADRRRGGRRPPTTATPTRGG